MGRPPRQHQGWLAHNQVPRLNDKNSLFDRGSIGEMGLCVEKNRSQYMGVLGYPVARGIVRDARAGEAGLRGG